MKNSLIIIIFTILFLGCTINVAPTQEQAEEKVPAQIEMKQAEKKTHEPWPKGEKEYWYARYFFNMAVNPQIQLRLKPKDVFEIVKCVVAKYEKDHSWEWFVANLHDQKTITPEVSQYVFVTTQVCAKKQALKGVKPTPTLSLDDAI
tara:strand:+ start:5803 stop:6243 length:441 start_codon:yes stop_codon:yes gene_type:complete